MVHFGYTVLIRRSVYLSVLLCVHIKKEVFSLSLLYLLYQGNTLSLTNVITYPHCFLTTYKSLCASVRFSWDVGFKKPRPILLKSCWSTTFCLFCFEWGLLITKKRWMRHDEGLAHLATTLEDLGSILLPDLLFFFLFPFMSPVS